MATEGNIATEKSEDEIVEEIIDTSLRQVSTEIVSKQVFLLRYGRKTLEVEFVPTPDKSAFDVSTFAHNRKTKREEKDNETTLLYTAARVTMQEIANKSGLPIHYTYDTDIREMGLWGISHGEKIFNWDTKEISGEEPMVRYFLEKTILPEKK